MSSAEWLLCFPLGTRSVGRVFFWSYLFYLAKYCELLITFIRILRREPVGFVHVLHRLTPVWVCFFWLEFSQSLQVLEILTSTLTKAIVGSYQFWRPIYRPKLVATCQLAEFSIRVAGFFWMLRLHFMREGCNGMAAWVFNACAYSFLFFINWNSNRKQHFKAPDLSLDRCVGDRFSQSKYASVEMFNIGDFLPSLAWMDLQGVQKKMKNLHSRFDQFFSRILEEHKAEARNGRGKNDFLSVLLSLRNDATDPNRLPCLDPSEPIENKNNGEEEEIDPLDAFMAGIHEEMNNAPAKPDAKIEKFSDDKDDPMKSFLMARKDAGLTLAAEALQAGYDSDEEVYAAAKAVDVGLLEYDSDDNAIVLDKKKIEPISALDHSEIDYEPFNKDLTGPYLKDGKIPCFLNDIRVE